MLERGTDGRQAGGVGERLSCELGIGFLGDFGLLVDYCVGGSAACGRES